MRIRVHVTTTATVIPWPELHRAGRGLIYALLAETAPQLATRVHEHGWGPRRMAPFGYCPPVFPHAPRIPGAYAAGGPGWFEVGTPIPEVARALAAAFTRRRTVDWGGVLLHITRIDLHAPPDLGRGRVAWKTLTPVVLKNGTPGTQTWILPGENGWEGRLGMNLRRKAETLGLPDNLTVLRLLWSGAKRAHVVASGNDGQKRGARAKVLLRGDPRVLSALWCWGLGEATAAGFGWVEESAPRLVSSYQPHEEAAAC